MTKRKTLLTYDFIDDADASDEQIKATLQHPRRWSYAVRDSSGRTICWGRGATLEECEEWAATNAEAFAAEESAFTHLRPETWRFLIWAPTQRRKYHHHADQNA